MLASAGTLQVFPSKFIQDLSSPFPEMSRVRSHKGNIPSLPQTKQCSMCPAKFTRTTHLNRHIRSHTNERQHQCDICHSQFTRSDLLTRHKRTCGDNSNVYRSRRKSCQACAESKIRCDLDFPCSKCVSRGKECIFVNDPEASKAKRLAAAEKARRKLKEASKPVTPTKERSASIASFSQSVQDQQFTPSEALFPSPSSRRSSLDIPAFSFGSSSSSSSAPSPGSDEFDPMFNALGPSHLMQGLSADDPTSLAAHLKALLPRSSPDSFLKSIGFDDQLSSFLPQTQSNLADFHPENLTWLETPGELDINGGVFQDNFQFGVNGYGLLPNEQFLGHDYCSIPQVVPLKSTSAPNLVSSGPFTSDHSKTSSQSCDSVLSGGATEYDDPPAAELQQYLYLFFSAFSTQVPLIHLPTWQMEGKPTVLIRAMQACGAVFVRTATAQRFILDTLGCTRDILMLEFARTPTDSPEYLALVIAVVLLQTVGLFHESSEIRSASNVYHGMLVMMIRRTGLINRIATWYPPDMIHSGNREAAWHEWCTYETAKRTLIFAYLHDCFHCVLFAIAPSFRPCEFEISLPCDDSLWQASTSSEWLSIMQTHAGTGVEPSSICGTGMQAALAYLSQDSSNATSLPLPPPLNPFGHFVLIQTVLRNLYECRTSGCSFPTTTPNMSNTESALRNWLHAWLTHESSSPSSPSPLLTQPLEPAFTYNSMPFFWLAQISLVEVREGQALSPSGILDDSRFNYVSRWTFAIRNLICKGKLEPEVIWEQLMTTRARGVESEREFDEQEGLLGFFSPC